METIKEKIGRFSKTKNAEDCPYFQDECDVLREKLKWVTDSMNTEEDPIELKLSKNTNQGWITVRSKTSL